MADSSDTTFAQIVLSNVGSQLLDLLTAEAIVPGSAPSYELCKQINAYHPLGKKIADGPINMAQSQKRTISVPGCPESVLIPAFDREWKAMGGIGADTLINNTMKTARIYGIGSLVVGDRNGGSSDTPLDFDTLHDKDLFFNVLDPLNTAGSLVLNQDPNAADFQKAQNLRAAGREWHPSRWVVIMNEQPLYIEFTSSAFGFVGRSVYQRALFPMKSFLQSMITDDMVIKKIALLIWKAKSPSSAINNRIMNIFGWKRQQLQGGMTGNVLTIGDSEDIQSLNFQNLEGAGKFTRENVLKNIATAADMPARMLDQETLVSGFGEGSEDAKQIARYIDRVREEMNPLYAFCDRIAMRKAWSPRFYEGVQKQFEEYRKIEYKTAFYEWQNKFTAVWPNLLTEPDSEMIKVEETKFKSVTALVEVLAPLLGPKNKAILTTWAADQASEAKKLFVDPLILDEDELKEDPQGLEDDEEGREPKPVAFSSHT